MTPTKRSLERARDLIEGYDEEICSNCEGSGLIYADRKAHYPFENAKTVSCSYCHEGKRAISDETRILMLAQALDQAREETFDEAIKVTCKYCDCGRPLIGNTHTWQVLTSKNKKGEYKYNPVQEECLAKAIRELSKNDK